MLRVSLVLFTVVLFGLASSAKLKESEKKGECVDNTLYAKYVCENQKDGTKIIVPGKCSEYYECKKGVSTKKSCSKFFDPESQKCVKESTCVEVDNTDCVIPTPPPCVVTPATPPSPPPACQPTPCECPQCPPPAICPAPPVCPPPTVCPPPSCPAPPSPAPPSPAPPSPAPPSPAPPSPAPPSPAPPAPSQCPPPSAGPCGNWFDPNDLYGSFVCKDMSDGTMLIVPSSCTDYYYCIGGHSYRKSCGKDLYFNPEAGACDEKSKVFCPKEKNLLQ